VVVILVSSTNNLQNLLFILKPTHITLLKTYLLDQVLILSCYSEIKLVNNNTIILVLHSLLNLTMVHLLNNNNNNKDLTDLVVTTSMRLLVVLEVEVVEELLLVSTIRNSPVLVTRIKNILP